MSNMDHFIDKSCPTSYYYTLAIFNMIIGQLKAGKYINGITKCSHGSITVGTSQYAITQRVAINKITMYKSSKMLQQIFWQSSRSYILI